MKHRERAEQAEAERDRLRAALVEIVESYPSEDEIHDIAERALEGD